MRARMCVCLCAHMCVCMYVCVRARLLVLAYCYFAKVVVQAVSHGCIYCPFCVLFCSSLWVIWMLKYSCSVQGRRCWWHEPGTMPKQNTPRARVGGGKLPAIADPCFPLPWKSATILHPIGSTRGFGQPTKSILTLFACSRPYYALATIVVQTKSKREFSNA